MTAFDFEKARRQLNIKRRPFDPDYDRNVRGYSHERWFAINPSEQSPEFVAFHEWAHILLGHTMLHKKLGYSADLYLYKRLNHDVHEAECHAAAIVTAMLTGTRFDLDAELEHLGAYLQGRKLPASSKKRVFDVAVAIAKAGGMRGVAPQGQEQLQWAA